MTTEYIYIGLEAQRVATEMPGARGLRVWVVMGMKEAAHRICLGYICFV